MCLGWGRRTCLPLHHGIVDCVFKCYVFVPFPFFCPFPICVSNVSISLFCMLWAMILHICFTPGLIDCCCLGTVQDPQILILISGIGPF